MLTLMLDGLPQRDTLTFFTAFARFEYALMQCNFLIGSDKHAEADWRKLAAALSNEFFERASPLVPTLANNPPKKLIIKDRRPVFGEAPPVAVDTAQLLQHARNVRNNLFHGNKMFAADRQRDQLLMREALILLELVMNERPDLRGAFDEPQANF